MFECEEKFLPVLVTDGNALYVMEMPKHEKKSFLQQLKLLTTFKDLDGLITRYVGVSRNLFECVYLHKN